VPVEPRCEWLRVGVGKLISVREPERVPQPLSLAEWKRRVPVREPLLQPELQPVFVPVRRKPDPQPVGERVELSVGLAGSADAIHKPLLLQEQSHVG
jgi:hypothetical protein